MKSQGKNCLTWSEFSFCQILSRKYLLKATEAYVFVGTHFFFLELDCNGLSHESGSNVLDVGERRVFYLSLALPIIHLRLLGNTVRPWTKSHQSTYPVFNRAKPMECQYLA